MMERVVYSKYTDYRKKEYQIYTNIYIDNQSKYVRKKSVYQCGKKHLNDIYGYYQPLQNIYAGMGIKPTTCRWKGEELEFDYVEGKTYKDLIRDNIDLDYIDVIKEYLSIICGKDDNIIGFYMTDQFKEWFGEYDCFEGVPACKFANLDSNVGNVLINDSGKWIIDYEWCFDYPIPVEFVKYINLSWLYYFDVPELQEKHTFSDFLAMFNICDYLDIYQQMERMHGKNIDIENNTNVNMSMLKNKFLDQKVWNMNTVFFEIWQCDCCDNVKKKDRYDCTISAFNKKGQIVIDLLEGVEKIKIYILDSGVMSIKWMNILSDGKSLPYRVMNGYEDGAYVFFDAKAPLIEVDINDKDIRQVNVSGHFYAQDDADLIDVYHRNSLMHLDNRRLRELDEIKELELVQLSNQNDDLKQQVSNAESEIEAKNLAIQNLTGELQIIRESKSWRLISFFNRMIDFILRRK